MFKLIADSTSDFSLEEGKEKNIEIACLNVNFGDEVYIDKTNITNEEFFYKLENHSQLPKTTLVNSARWEKIFKEFDGDTLVITLSSELSGTYNAALIAKEALGRDNIYVVDSRSVTCGTRLLVTYADTLRQSGKPASEVYEILEKQKEKLRIHAAVDTLTYLVKGGRISKTSGLIGNLLNVKPIVAVKDGIIQSVSKARKMTKALEKIIENHLPSVGNIDLEKGMCFGNAMDNEGCKKFAEMIVAAHGDFNYEIVSIGSVVGTYSGKGAIAVGYFKK